MQICIKDEWQNKECIYLDWNVYKYMRTPRDNYIELDTNMLCIIQKLKNKFIIPYSEGHIKDRSTRFCEQYKTDVERDFEFAESITDQYLLIANSMISELKRRKSYPEIVVARYPMMEYFDEYINMSVNSDVKPERITFENFYADMSLVNECHPLYKFLQKYEGNVIESNFNTFLDNLYKYIMDDIDEYRRLRLYVTKLETDEILNQKMNTVSRLQVDRLLYYMAPMIEAMHDDEDTLAQKWKSICCRWFSLNTENPSLEMLLKEGYVLLDFHPLFHDKLKKKKNTVENIVRDGNHCYYASRARFFVSEDENIRKKTKLMYKAFGIKTKVVSEDEFAQKYDVL